jgi:hypothetical protein
VVDSMSTEHVDVSCERRLVLRRKRNNGTATPEEIEEHKALEVARRTALRHNDPAVKARDAEASRKHYEANRDRLMAAMREYHKNLSPEAREKHNAANRTWAQQTGYDRTPARIDKKAARAKERYATEPDLRVKLNIRNRIYRVLKTGYSGTVLKTHLGCTPEELMAYIESLWTEGMSWDNYTYYGWHIDHKRPLASFDLTDQAQLAVAVHYTNLQPMWQKDNASKNDKWDGEWQKPRREHKIVEVAGITSRTALGRPNGLGFDRVFQARNKKSFYWAFVTSGKKFTCSGFATAEEAYAAVCAKRQELSLPI